MSIKALSEGENVWLRGKTMGQTKQHTPADYRGRGDTFVRLIRYGAGGAGAGAGSAGAGAGSAGAGAAAGASTGAGAGAEF